MSSTETAPFNFKEFSTGAAHDERQKNAVSSAVQRQYLGRQSRLKELPDADKLRTLAGDSSMLWITSIIIWIS